MGALNAGAPPPVCWVEPQAEPEMIRALSRQVRSGALKPCARCGDGVCAQVVQGRLVVRRGAHTLDRVLPGAPTGLAEAIGAVGLGGLSVHLDSLLLEIMLRPDPVSDPQTEPGAQPSPKPRPPLRLSAPVELDPSPPPAPEAEPEPEPEAEPEPEPEPEPPRAPRVDGNVTTARPDRRWPVALEADGGVRLREPGFVAPTVTAGVRIGRWFARGRFSPRSRWSWDGTEVELEAFGGELGWRPQLWERPRLSVWSELAVGLERTGWRRLDVADTWAASALGYGSGGLGADLRWGAFEVGLGGRMWGAPGVELQRGAEGPSQTVSRWGAEIAASVRWRP